MEGGWAGGWMDGWTERDHAYLRLTSGVSQGLGWKLGAKRADSPVSTLTNISVCWQEPRLAQ